MTGHNAFKTEVLADGFEFLEGPRWRDGRLWMSDSFGGQVFTVGADGGVETVVEVPGKPSGLGFLPDGTPLIVSMKDRRLLRLEKDGLVSHAELGPLVTGVANDMVVDAEGRAYVGNFGFDRHQGEEPCAATMARVDADGSVHVAAADLMFPNGTIITDDGRTLVVGETMANRLTAFDRAEDGSLSNRRLFADLGGTFPDGICLDQEGAIWVADPRGNEVVRVHQGGRISRRISTGDHGAFACMLGGGDGQTLFICTAAGSWPVAAEAPTGRVQTTRVDVPGAGLP